MRTEDFIGALSRDAKQAGETVGKRLLGVEITAVAIAALLFFSNYGLRPDLVAALASPWFLLKAGIAALVAASAFPLVAAMGRPGAGAPLGYLGGALGLLAAAAVADLAIAGTSGAMARMTGRNAALCLTVVPFLAAAPLIAALIALRHGAPTRPILAGASAGLLGGAIGAAFYAWQCPDDSPLFVAVWYTLAIAIVAAAGAIAGGLFLRWRA